MVKINKKVIWIFVIIGIIFVGISSNDLVEENETIIFPYEFEVDDYNIEIEYSKLYDNYLLTKYKIWRKDGSYIGENEANLSTFINTYDSAFALGPHIISSKVIDNKIKEEISIDFVAAIENPLEKVKIRHALAGKYIDGTKEIKKEGVVNLSNENYTPLNKKIKIDHINLTISNLGNFEFGSILNLFTENLENEEAENFHENYSIKLKSNDFSKIYEIKQMMILRGKAAEEVIKWNKLNKDTKLIEFFIVDLLYDVDSIDFNNFELFVVNKNTNEETKIY
ncbi:hypothetical protein [Clostridium perfringens]|uniref:hypothetical protein n=1 Tax=Clostridium perfringens TaxID=1502 RepID=UPI0034A17108